jgi:hypothetical protein
MQKNNPDTINETTIFEANSNHRINVESISNEENFLRVLSTEGEGCDSVTLFVENKKLLTDV